MDEGGYLLAGRQCIERSKESVLRLFCSRETVITDRLVSYVSLYISDH
jgi:hypothetical protein